MMSAIKMPFSRILLFLVLIITQYSEASKAPKLEGYRIDRDKLSVSGLSSGAYFAVQYHVAFSSLIIGAGVVAGGPFWCAQDDVEIALSACMKDPTLISVDKLVTITHTTAITTRSIDSPSNLKNSRVYLFSGTKDTAVKQGVMVKLAEYYSKFMPSSNINTEFTIPAEHSMVTNSYGNSCGFLGSPYINNCNYSTAYHLLQHIYQDIVPSNGTAAISDNLIEFDQSEFFVDLPNAVSMDTIGYVYVPNNCQNKQKVCRLHIAFHGCLQGRVFLSDKYPLYSGYNSIAEVNDIVVLYPQARNSTLNPKGCWDWWGYTSPAYASKLGPQIAGVKLMMDRASSSKHFH